MRLNPRDTNRHFRLTSYILLLTSFFSSTPASSWSQRTRVWSTIIWIGILNPILAADSNSYQVMGYIYETLLELDNETLEYKPLLADIAGPCQATILIYL